MEEAIMTKQSNDEMALYLARLQHKRTGIITELNAMPQRQQALQQELAKLEVEMETLAGLMLTEGEAT